MYRSIESTPLPEWVANKLPHGTKDRIVEKVIDNYRSRSEVGIKKYGTTLERTDLSFDDWCKHITEELMDATLYIERLREEYGEARIND